MDITTTQQGLRQALSLVSHVAGGKSALPILQAVLFTAEFGGLRLTAFNEETGIHYHIPAEVREGGSVLLPARLLSEFVSDLPQASLTLTAPATKDATAALIRCQQAKALIKQPGLPCDEFPHVPAFSDGNGEEWLLLDCELLKEIVNQVAFMATRDESRPALTGVQVAIHQGVATFVAADAFRLAMRTIAIPDTMLDGELLIPARTLIELARMLPSSGFVRMLLTPGRKAVLFHTEQMDLSARLLNHTFPDFRRAIPATSETRAVLSTSALQTALRLMTPFARASEQHVRLSIVGEGTGVPGVKLEATAPDLGENEMRLDASVVGPEQSVLLNCSQVAELLSALPGTEVTLGLSAAQRPVELRPVGPIDAVSVIMPMFLRSASRPSTSQASTNASPAVATAASHS